MIIRVMILIFTTSFSSFSYFMQLWTKKVVMTRVINDPTNFRIFPILVRLIFICSKD